MAGSGERVMIKHSDQFDLDGLIGELKRFDLGDYVEFDFAGMSIGSYSSYRGYYEDLCLIPERRLTRCAELLIELSRRYGDVFEGWKGGAYKMSGDSALWVAFEGCTSGTIITGVDKVCSTVVIRTRKAE